MPLCLCLQECIMPVFFNYGEGQSLDFAGRRVWFNIRQLHIVTYVQIGSVCSGHMLMYKLPIEWVDFPVNMPRITLSFWLSSQNRLQWFLFMFWQQGWSPPPPARLGLKRVKSINGMCPGKGLNSTRATSPPATPAVQKRTGTIFREYHFFVCQILSNCHCVFFYCPRLLLIHSSGNGLVMNVALT